MLTDEWAIIFNLLSIALIGLLAATALLLSVWSIAARRIDQLSACTQKSILWFILLTPWAVSLFCVLLFVPSMFQSENTFWLNRMAHWHHPNVFYLTSWHSVTLLLFMLGFIYVLVTNGLRVIRHLKALDTLTLLSRGKARHQEIGQDVIVLESGTPSAFTAGLLNPKCYVTTGLIEQVSETELNIIIGHEQAHIKHKDTLRKLLFSLFASLYPKPVARHLNQLFSSAAEQLADAELRKSHCTLEIARTLVKTARIQRSFDENVRPARISHVIENDVASRVSALVSPQRFQSFPWVYCLLFITLTTIISSNGVDALHHLVETVFSH